MVKVSIIIPVYNMEKYLTECLDSVLSQSLEDIEIICINDGSDDSSLNILNDYKKDSRVKVASQENRGAGAGRNHGLEYACGEYVYFMDSDDYLEHDALEKCYNLAIDKEADFVIFKICNFYDETGDVIDDDYYSMPHLRQIVGTDTFCYDDVSKIALDLCVCPPGNLFKRDFIEDIRFPEGLLFEDNVFFTHALFKAQKIVFLDEFLYHRRRHRDSTTSAISVRSLDTIEITNMLLELCMRYGHMRHKGELYYRIFNNIYQIFKKADESDRDVLFEKIKHDYLKYKEIWQSDDYFNNKLNPKYKHIFNCALKSKNAKRFESCVDGYSKKSRFKKLRERLL